MLYCCWRRLHEQCYYEWRDALKKSGGQVNFRGEVAAEWTEVQTKCDRGQSIIKGLLKPTPSEHMKSMEERIDERLQCGQQMVEDGTVDNFINQPDPDRTPIVIEPLLESHLWKNQIPGSQVVRESSAMVAQ